MLINKTVVVARIFNWFWGALIVFIYRVQVKSPVGQKPNGQNPHGQKPHGKKKPNHLTEKWSKAPSLWSNYPITIGESSDMIRSSIREWHIPWIAIKNGEGVWIFMINRNEKKYIIFIPLYYDHGDCQEQQSLGLWPTGFLTIGLLTIGLLTNRAFVHGAFDHGDFDHGAFDQPGFWPDPLFIP